jgi:hypothetical protein
LLGSFPHFFFRKRNVEQRKLSHEEIRRQTAHSFAKIFNLAILQQKFLNAQFVADLYRRISYVRKGMPNAAM